MPIVEAYATNRWGNRVSVKLFVKVRGTLDEIQSKAAYQLAKQTAYVKGWNPEGRSTIGKLMQEDDSYARTYTFCEKRK